VKDIVDIAVGVLKSMWDVMSDPIGSFSRLISSQLSQPGNKGSSQITGVWSKVFNKPAEWIRDLPVPENLQLLYPDLQIGAAWSKGEFYKGVGKSVKENGGKLGGGPGGTGGPKTIIDYYRRVFGHAPEYFKELEACIRQHSYA
jgi:hypothetical protein